MDIKNLIKEGLTLSKELTELSKQYHIKSDTRDILEYEAATVEEELRDLIKGCGVKEHLRESTLLSEWGNSIIHQLPDPKITVRVREFHEKCKNT